ncbi:chaperone modulator CbpM [Bordetella sp. BOR01]|uniref:chaperone modulator CbpM n=1 Tax=Bordetella sp. BOR01 TaxID=2854779 RepID=UPI001C4814B8|nr:chaperone modulator CbpM [Bordetella sp. BOR01]MBV7482608.1 chaperone modulator CbpM [Bordetella sp. BOR01]
MKTVVIAASGTLVGKAEPLSADDLARACGAEVEWVTQLVQVGIVQAQGSRPVDWRFHSGDLQRALETRRLERDFGACLDAAALILDLSQEVRQLRAQLRALDRSDG